MNSKVTMGGKLAIKVIRAPGPGLGWKLRNTLRPSYLWGWIVNLLALGFTKLTGIVTITSVLSARLIRADGSVVNYGVLSRRVVTDAGVAFMVDDWDGSGSPGDISSFNYHGVGTGTTAEAASQTGLTTESTTVLNPDSTRATGTKSQPSANVLRSVGTVTFDGSATIAEHGLFSQSATGGGTLWDRSQFTGIPVGTGDSIQFTFDVTLNSGG